MRYMGEVLAAERLATALVSSCGGMALVLALVGVYGVMAYAVVRRSREIGVRLALGARPMQIMKLVFSEGLRLTALGGIIGLVVAAAIPQLLGLPPRHHRPRRPLTGGRALDAGPGRGHRGHRARPPRVIGGPDDRAPTSVAVKACAFKASTIRKQIWFRDRCRRDSVSSWPWISHFIWMNGTLVEASEATVPFLTSGFHYGIGVFEGIRAYATSRGPAVFRLRDHLKRMELSCKILGFRELPYSLDELAEATRQTIRANGFDECYIRPLVWLAEGGWNLTLDTGVAHVGIAVWRQSVYLGHDARAKGLRANVSSFTRHHPAAVMTKAKISGNYVNSFLAKTDAHRQGFDEAIMLDPEGYVAECTGANLFIVRGDASSRRQPSRFSKASRGRRS